MHVIKPSDIVERNKVNKISKRRKTMAKLLIFLIMIGGLGLMGSFILRNTDRSVNLENTELGIANDVKDQDSTHVLSAPQKLNRTFINFTGVEFKNLYRAIFYPNTEAIVIAPEITGNASADKIIVDAAKKRGFKLTSRPVFPIMKLTGEVYLEESTDDLLQPLALLSWMELKTAAKSDNIELGIVSGYRSIERQRQLFVDRLLAQGVTIEQVASGQANNAVDSTLSLTAVPGFSRHHTGYTVDFHCGDEGQAFVNSICNQWLTKNNYENAKKFGWIPSYPPDAGEQGPEPEPWEFVWVGADVLYKE